MQEKVLRITKKRMLPGLLLLIFLLSCKEKSSERNIELADQQSKAENIAPPIVEVTAADYAFGMPSEVPSGWVTFRMKNMGQEAHNGIIYKYSDSITYEGLAEMISEALEQGGIQAFQEPNSHIETAMGGPAILSPGLTGQTTAFLEPGVYALTCWMVAEDGEFHVQKGLTRPFMVTEENTGADKPQGTVNISLENFAINIKDSIPPGEHIFNVDFETKENVHLAKLEEGQEMEDLKKWMNKVQHPSPFTFLGGAEQAPVGMSSTFKANLEPGRYALVTYGVAVNGMAEEFIIPENGAAGPAINKPVNPSVTVEVNSQAIEVKGDLKEGRTPLTIKNSGAGGFYILSMVKPDATFEDFKQYTEDAYVYGKIDFQKHTPPFYDIWQGAIPSGEEKNFNLEVKDAVYVLTGPILPEQSLEAQWKGDEMFHVFGPDRN